MLSSPATEPVALHPASAAVHAARALGKPAREDLWTAVLSGPNIVTIHPPLALASGQIEETIERLKADFPGARVRITVIEGVTLFVLFLGATA